MPGVRGHGAGHRRGHGQRAAAFRHGHLRDDGVHGLVLAAVLNQGTGGRELGGNSVVLLPAVALLMITIGLLAALGPARRALDV